MTLYRARNAISVGERVILHGGLVRPGALSRRSVEGLLRIGVLTPVSPPPLAVLPGWAHRSKRLAEVGIVDAEQALTCDASEVAGHLGVSPGLFERWRCELEWWLSPPTQRQG